MILFQGCPRCRGDVDVTYHDDVRCIQCGHRPKVVYPGPRIVVEGPGVAGGTEPVLGEVTASAMCPRCGSELAIRLDRLRPGDNACYRCISCGHIFSPSGGDALEFPGAALP